LIGKGGGGERGKGTPASLTPGRKRKEKWVGPRSCSTRGEGERRGGGGGCGFLFSADQKRGGKKTWDGTPGCRCGPKKKVFLSFRVGGEKRETVVKGAVRGGKRGKGLSYLGGGEGEGKKDTRRWELALILPYQEEKRGKGGKKEGGKGPQSLLLADEIEGERKGERRPPTPSNSTTRGFMWGKMGREGEEKKGKLFF